MDGGGKPDFLVGATTFYESGPASNASCDPGPCLGAGRVWFYRGEEVAGSNPAVILDSPFKVVKNPMAQTDDPSQPTVTDNEYFGHTSVPIGNVGKCNIDPGPSVLCTRAQGTNTPDGLPEVVISGYRTDFPEGFPESGVAYLVEGRSGAILSGTTTRGHNPPAPSAFRSTTSRPSAT